MQLAVTNNTISKIVSLARLETRYSVSKLSDEEFQSKALSRLFHLHACPNTTKVHFVFTQV